jgi:GGDEF domain-containing protein
LPGEQTTACFGEYPEAGMNNKRVRVLLAERGDSEVAQGLRTLYPEGVEGVELTIVSTISTLIPTLNVVDPEVLLLDLSLLQPDSRETVRHIHRAAPDSPLVILADPSEKEQAGACLLEGAMDYMLKGYTDQQTLRRVMQRVLEHNTLKGLTDLLRDPVTRLYIREGFLTLGTRAGDTARENGGTLVLLCALCENLETVREEFGPGAAGQTLCDVARILCGCFRRTDVLARIGPAHFAALAVDAVEPSAPVLRQRVEKRFAVYNQAQDGPIPLEMRLKVGHWNPKDSTTFPEFLDIVEAGLRAASPEGKREPAIGGPAMRS